jgi:hypothetical protein
LALSNNCFLLKISLVATSVLVDVGGGGGAGGIILCCIATGKTGAGCCRIGILTVILRRYFFTKGKFFFNNNYNIIGDFDLFLRLQRVTKFACVQQPLAIYRIHKNNFSIKNYNLYIAELENWLKSQKILKYKQQLNFIIDKINYMKVMLQIYKGSKINALFRMIETPFSLNKIKLFIMLLLPLFILKRIKDIN